MNKTYDIVIVGAGIVGATLAALLSQSKALSACTIALVDANRLDSGFTTPVPSPIDVNSFDPRVVALSESARSILNTAKAWESIIQHRACAYFGMQVWDADGTGHISFDTDTTPSDALGYICENRVVLAALYKVLEASPNPIDCLFGEALTRVHRGQSDNTQMYFESGLELNAKLVIGADGAHSKLRNFVGIDTKEWDYDHTAIVSTVETERGHSFCAWQRFSVQGPLAFLPLSADGVNQQFSSIVWSVDSGYAEQLMSLPEEVFRDTLGRALEYELGEVKSTATRHAVPLRQRFAKRYIQPGLALVGDAAHTIHPLAGQGVNLGLYDVHVLADELQRACSRNVPVSDLSILRRFERKRQPHNLLTMASMEAFKRAFGSDDIAMRWLRNTGLNVADRHPLFKRAFSHFAAGMLSNG